METSSSRMIGLALLIIGIVLAINFGGNRGFSNGVLSGLAYIGGFIIAFIGAYFVFVYGRTKNREE